MYVSVLDSITALLTLTQSVVMQLLGRWYSTTVASYLP